MLWPCRLVAFFVAQVHLLTAATLHETSPGLAARQAGFDAQPLLFLTMLPSLPLLALLLPALYLPSLLTLLHLSFPLGRYQQYPLAAEESFPYFAFLRLELFAVPT